MAVVNFYNDIFGEDYDKVEVKDITVKDAIDQYLATKEMVSEVMEVYHADTDTTTYETFTPDGYKVIITVNGTEVPADFLLHKSDVCIIVFIPQGQNKNATAGWLAAAGCILFIGGLIIAGPAIAGLVANGSLMSSAHAAAFYGGLLVTGIGAACIAGGVVMSAKEGTGTTGDEKKKNQVINGGENESIIGQPYPYTMGRHLLNPWLLGTPYHETRVSSIGDGKFIEQTFHALYCAGYGPLKLTDLRLGNTYLAMNRSTNGTDRKTILHGHIYNREDDDDLITSTWKYNDVHLEIIQAGGIVDRCKAANIDDIDNKYGIIYPQSVAEKQVNTPVLFAYDKDISPDNSTMISYYNQALISGFRTNTVKYSASAPRKIQVEIDMSEGFFQTWSKSSDGTTYYQEIPLNLAVQWRFRRSTNSPSDPESPKGWTSFSHMVFENSNNVTPCIYSEQARSDEIDENKGLSDGTKKTYNSKWLGSEVFAIPGTSKEYTQYLTQEEIDERVEAGELTVEYEEVSYTYQESYWFFGWHSKTNTIKFTMKRIGKTTTTPSDLFITKPTTNDELRAAYKKGEYAEGPDVAIIGCDEVYIRYSKLVDNKAKEKDKYNIDERRYVFEYDFTEEECRKLCGFEGDVGDAVEVRVIRLTPCYLDENQAASSDVSTVTYADLVNWQYLRTWKFDKTKYRQALDDATNNGKSLATIKVDDYPERPQPIEDDLNKFCYIALSIKQNRIESSDANVKKLSCISQSFAPKFDYVDQKWYPEVDQFCYTQHGVNNGVFYLDRQLEEISIYPKTYAWTADNENYYADTNGELNPRISVHPTGEVIYTSTTYEFDGKLYIRVIYGKNYWKNVTLVASDNEIDTYRFSGIDEIYKYYNKKKTALTSGGYKTEVKEISKEDYMSHISSSTPENYYYKQRYGTDFADQIRNEVFSSLDHLDKEIATMYSSDMKNFYNFNLIKGFTVANIEIPDICTFSKVDTLTRKVYKNPLNNKYYLYKVLGQYMYPTLIPQGCTVDSDGNISVDIYKCYIPITKPMLNYVVTDEIERKYITSNTASVFVGALVNGHLGSDAKTYDSIDMDSMADAYEFYEDVTDGTEQVYRINPVYDTSISLTLAARKKTKQQMIDAGYDSFDGTYATTYTSTYIDNDTTPNVAYVLTPIKNDGTVLSQGELDNIGQSLVSGLITTSDLILARFTGNNCLRLADKYTNVLHKIQEVYYTDSYYYRYFQYLCDKHVNAVADGLYIDVVSDIMLKLNVPFGDRQHVIGVIEQMSLDICRNSDNNYEGKPAICLASDGYKHVRFECNGILNKEVKLETLLSQIMLTGRSFVKRSEDNKYEALVGRPDPYPVTIINQRDCISKSNNRSFSEVPCGLLVSCTDEDDNYSVNNFYIMEQGEDYRNPTKKIDPFQMDYVTSKWQLALLARYNLACLIYQRENYSRTVGKIGYVLSLGNTVLIQDDSLLIGTDHGARIMQMIEDDDFIYGFVTDEPFEYTGQKDDEGRCVQGCSILQPSKFDKNRCVTLRFRTSDSPVVFESNLAVNGSGALMPYETTADYFIKEDDEFVMVKVVSESNYNNKYYYKAVDDITADNWNENKNSLYCIYDNQAYSQSGRDFSSNAVYYRFDGGENLYKGYVMKPGLTNLCLIHTPIIKDSGYAEDIGEMEVGDIYQYHPKIDNLVAFGNVGSITSKAILMAYKPKESSKFELSFVPYNEELYFTGQGIPVFNSNMTSPNREGEFAFNGNVTVSELQEKANNISVSNTGYVVDMDRSAILFDTNQFGRVTEEQSFDTTITVSKGRMVLLPVESDPGTGEFSVSISNQDPDKIEVSKVIDQDNYTMKITVKVSVDTDLSDISDSICITINAEGTDL